MNSPGRKIEWRCPNCQSPNIGRMRMLGQKSGECRDCQTWWPWRARLKRPVVS